MKAAKHTENCTTMRCYKTYTHVALANVKTNVLKLAQRMTSSKCIIDYIISKSS